MGASQFLIPAAIALGVFLFIRRRYASSLSDIPGPFLASFSIIWQVWHVAKGDIEWRSIELHEKHGTYI